MGDDDGTLPAGHDHGDDADFWQRLMAEYDSEGRAHGCNLCWIASWS
jgi:hypothetical protein